MRKAGRTPRAVPAHAGAGLFLRVDEGQCYRRSRPGQVVLVDTTPRPLANDEGFPGHA